MSKSCVAVLFSLTTVSYTHLKFLADIEIYVDGIATMQIQNLNALVDLSLIHISK